MRFFTKKWYHTVPFSSDYGTVWYHFFDKTGRKTIFLSLRQNTNDEYFHTKAARKTHKNLSSFARRKVAEKTS